MVDFERSCNCMATYEPLVRGLFEIQKWRCTSCGSLNFFGSSFNPNTGEHSQVYHEKNPEHGMFSDAGNISVSRIVEAARRFRETEDIERVWEWAQNELIKLSMSEGYAPTHDFSEATHAEVIEAVYDRLVADQN